MADLKGILNYYRREGWLIVPGYYNTEGKEPRCRICGWENDHATERICQNCGYRKRAEGRTKKQIDEIDVRRLELEEWQVFQVIAQQILRGETPYITVEEFAEVCKARIDEMDQNSKIQKTEQQRINEILHSS